MANLSDNFLVLTKGHAPERYSHFSPSHHRQVYIMSSLLNTFVSFYHEIEKKAFERIKRRISVGGKNHGCLRQHIIDFSGINDSPTIWGRLI